MKNKKITFIVIIVLLVLFLPTSIYATYLHFKLDPDKNLNPNHELKYDNQLFFYNEEDKLLGTYACQNAICDIASSSNNFLYSLKEYDSDEEKLPIIENRYVFLVDKPSETVEEVFLYDITASRNLVSYKSVKNYGVGIEDNLYIVENNQHKYGIIGFDDGIKSKISFEYDYIGIASSTLEELSPFSSDHFAILKEDTWRVINLNNVALSESLALPIISYNTNYIILDNNGVPLLIDYKNQPYLTNIAIKEIDFCGKYIKIVDALDTLYLYDLRKGEKVSNSYTLSEDDQIELEVTREGIHISLNGEWQETVAN